MLAYKTAFYVYKYCIIFFVISIYVLYDVKVFTKHSSIIHFN